jgi:hypothetical protein
MPLQELYRHGVEIAAGATHKPIFNLTGDIMANIIILYTLKAGVTQEQYESWTRTTDYPAMRGLTRVKSFVNYRTVKPLFGEGKPSVNYVEVFDIPDLDGFLQEDMGGSVVQKIMGEFMQFVDNPEFLLAEAVV